MLVRAFAEGAHARQFQGHGPGRDVFQLQVQVVGHVLADLAEEPQGDVEGLQRPPVGAGQAGLAGLQAFSQLRRDGDGGEQADHHTSLERLSREARSP